MFLFWAVGGGYHGGGRFGEIFLFDVRFFLLVDRPPAGRLLCFMFGSAIWWSIGRRTVGTKDEGVRRSVRLRRHHARTVQPPLMCVIQFLVGPTGAGCLPPLAGKTSKICCLI